MKKRKTEIILTIALLIGFVIGIAIFWLQYSEYKKYVHFKDKNLQRITQVETVQVGQSICSYGRQSRSLCM